MKISITKREKTLNFGTYTKTFFDGYDISVNGKFFLEANKNGCITNFNGCYDSDLEDEGCPMYKIQEAIEKFDNNK